MTTMREWFGKCKMAFSGPRLGQVFVLRQSGNANLFVAASGGRVLLWSPERGLRWLTKQWFKSRHARVFSREKVPIRYNLQIHDNSGALLSERQIAYIGETQMGTLKAGLAESKERLTSLLNGLETSRDVIIGTPVEFVLPFIIIGLLIGLLWAYLLI